MTTRGSEGWRGAAERLAGLLPEARLHPDAVRWARARPGRERWAIALSGGPDSVCLLLLLWALWPRRRGRLLALHFNHRLRGAESAADERFCGRLCRALGVAYARGAWSARRRPQAEAEARAARFGFLDAQMGRRRVRSLWLGHQQDDIAETMLMRLARGSGTGGLAAPRAVHRLGASSRSRLHLRPLLTLKKAEIEAALRGAGADWREDSSNATARHFRNRVRQDVIPRWIKAAGRDAQAGAALSRELLEEDDRALEAWVDEIGALHGDGRLELSLISDKPRAVQRRALHRWFLRERRAGEISRQGFEALLAAVARGSPVRHSIGSHGFAVIRGGFLVYESLRKRRTFH
jgi:tRNA(Ile)-lysidine synthase